MTNDDIDKMISTCDLMPSEDVTDILLTLIQELHVRLQKAEHEIKQAKAGVVCEQRTGTTGG